MQVSILLYDSCAPRDAQRHCDIDNTGHAWRHYLSINLAAPPGPPLPLDRVLLPQGKNYCLWVGQPLLYLHSKITDVTFIHTFINFRTTSYRSKCKQSNIIRSNNNIQMFSFTHCLAPVQTFDENFPSALQA